MMLFAVGCALPGGMEIGPKPADQSGRSNTSNPANLLKGDAGNQNSTQRLQVAAVKIPFVTLELEPRDLIAIVAAVISLCALCFTMWQAWLGALRSRAETFKSLRASYADLRKELRKVSSTWASLTVATVPSFAIIEDLERYWHHGFDEWYLTKRRRPLFYGSLWKDYYRPVLEKAARNDVLLIALFRAFSACDTEVDREFLQEIWSLTDKSRAEADTLVNSWNLAASSVYNVKVPDAIK
jgi:hypothetical protein